MLTNVLAAIFTCKLESSTTVCHFPALALAPQDHHLNIMVSSPRSHTEKHLDPELHPHLPISVVQHFLLVPATSVVVTDPQSSPRTKRPPRQAQQPPPQAAAQQAAKSPAAPRASSVAERQKHAPMQLPAPDRRRRELLVLGGAVLLCYVRFLRSGHEWTHVGDCSRMMRC